MAIKGSQGSVVYRTRNGMDVAIKSSKYNDSCLELESIILQQISNECADVADHFPKFIELSDGKLTMSRIINGEEFSEFIDRIYNTNCRSLRRRAHIIIKNLCCITLCALETIRRKIGVVHNDLHTSNVMIVKTEKEELSFEFHKKYTFKTFGYFPVVIDFGYAHVEGRVIGSLQNSDIGYTLEEQDLLADARLLLATAKYDRRTVKEIFGPLQLNGDGWFSKYTFTNVYDELYNIACKKTSKSMDAALTVVVSKMGDLSKEETMIPCCQSCYLTQNVEIIVFSDDEEEFSDEDDEYYIEDKSPICECCQKVKDVFEELYTNVRDNKVDQQIYEKAAVAFRPIIARSLAHNREIKKKEYAKLKVKNTLDVIDMMV